MFSTLLTPLLMLLSVFGLYSPPPRHSPQFQSAVTQAALLATTTDSKTYTSASAGQAQPRHTSSPAGEAREERLAPSASGLATGAQPSLTRSAIPAPELQPQYDFATDTESRIFSRMNAERAAEGLGALAHDPQLAKLARAHSADMLARGYFDHNDPEGCSSSCRADAADYEWTAIGENIYMTDGYELSADKEAAMVVDGWMRSPGHRANILGAKFTHTGVGIAVRGEKVFITAVYAKPR